MAGEVEAGQPKLGGPVWFGLPGGDDGIGVLGPADVAVTRRGLFFQGVKIVVLQVDGFGRVSLGIRA
ncbi:MAG: hypothetical protein ACRDTD_09470 [Pseudonocardiaceae bacterium]